MKRLTAVTFLFAVGFMFGTSPALAHKCPMMKKQSKDTKESKAMKKGMQCKMMKKHLKDKHGKHMKEGTQCKMMKKCMHEKGMAGKKGGMSGKKVIPTEDGGVLVQIGHKLIKYDEKMNKVGDATVQLSEEDMRQRMEHMQKMRKICHKKMQDDGREKEETEEKTEKTDEETTELSEEDMRELMNRMQEMLEEKSEEE